MLDADVIIRGERGTLNLAAWMTRHEDEGFEVAAITVAELWHGVERASGEHRVRRERSPNSISKRRGSARTSANL